MKKLLFIRVLAIILVAGSALLSLGVRDAFAVSVQPKVQAFYQDSLATKILSTDTSMTLVRGTDKEGNTLSGLYGFVIDEGTASQETVIGLAAGTSVTALVRGVSVINATSTVTGNKMAHARGATVKVTTWPSLGIINNELSGVEGIPVSIFYASGVSTTTNSLNRQNLASVGLLQDTAFNGASIINAATTNKGIVQIATGADAAASTGAGTTGALLVLPSSLATTTYNAATAANVIPLTGGTGKIDSNFLPTTIAGAHTYSGASTFSSTLTVTATSSATIGSFPAYQIGKNSQIFTSVGTTTFSVPSGVKVVSVQVVGAGAQGGGASSGSGAGGSAGGTAIKNIDVSATTTIQVFVGTKGSGAGANATGNSGTWSTFGTNGFYISAAGGVGGASGGNLTTGGAGSGGDLNITGGSGDGSHGTSGTSGGLGGSSIFGGPGAYGAGGNGCLNSGGSCAGGAPSADGIVIVRW